MSGSPKGTSPIVYEIQVEGRLTAEGAAWFEGLTLRVAQGREGETITALVGSIPDQAALFGLITRIRDLGLKLISINRVESGNVEKESA